MRNPAEFVEHYLTEWRSLPESERARLGGVRPGWWMDHIQAQHAARKGCTMPRVRTVSRNLPEIDEELAEGEAHDVALALHEAAYELGLKNNPRPKEKRLQRLIADGVSERRESAALTSSQRTKKLAKQVRTAARELDLTQ